MSETAETTKTLTTEEIDALVFGDNPWSLYRSKPGWDVANQELTAAIEQAKTVLTATKGKSVQSRRAERNRQYTNVVRPVMEKHGNLGACDSDSRDVIIWALDKAANLLNVW